jgi:hypothetical protein
MRDLALGRHNVGGHSVVAGVRSVDGRALFGRDDGFAYAGIGVGLSAGRKAS